MVVDSILPHAERGPNDHRKDAPPFSRCFELIRRISNFWKGTSASKNLAYIWPILSLVKRIWTFDDLWHIPESLHCTYQNFNLTLFTCKHFILWSEIFSLAGRLNLVLIWILTEGGAIQSRKKGMDFWYPIRLLHYDPIGWRTGQIFYHLSNFDQFSKYVTIINLAMSSAQPLSSKYSSPNCYVLSPFMILSTVLNFVNQIFLKNFSIFWHHNFWWKSGIDDGWS